MDRPWRVRLLGGLVARQGDRVIERFPTHQTASLLAYLATFRRQSHTREVLAELLWPESDPGRARHRLTQAASALRRQLEPPYPSPGGLPPIPRGAVLVSDREHLGLRVGSVTTDLEEFESALEEARRSPASPERLRALRRAEGWYAGPYLPGWYEEWCAELRDHLALRHQQLLLRLARELEVATELEEALEFARRAAATDPLWEEAHAELIRLLVRAGQTTAARHQLQELEAHLWEQLGQQPRPATRLLLQDAPPVETVSPLSGRGLTQDLPASPAATVTYLLIQPSNPDGLSGITAALEPQEAARRHGSALAIPYDRAREACEAAARVRDLAPDDGGSFRAALCTVELQRGEDGTGAGLEDAELLLLAANWGQIVCSETTAALVRRPPVTNGNPPAAALRYLGEYRIRGEPAAAEPVYELLPAGSTAPVRPLRAPRRVPTRLPLELSRFFGRQEELEALAELLQATDEASAPSARLVSLTGPGGTGKTRLAIEAARRFHGSTGETALFVSLAELSEPAQIPFALAGVLELPSQSAEPEEAVVEALRAQRTLLVLDNLEHLLTPDGGELETFRLLRRLLEGAPSLQLLITSRRQLGLPGEHHRVVYPLPVPKQSGNLEAIGTTASVQLFLDRARSAAPHFELTRANAGAVAALCIALEGIPLALELAAARCSTFTPAQILERLQSGLGVLGPARAGGAPRHQTLRAALDWSYRLLPEDLGKLMTRLSVFRGGFDLEAAEAVVPRERLADELEELCRNSLLQVRESVPDGMRYEMLETVAEYSREALGETAEALREAHARYYVRWVSRQEVDPWTHSGWERDPLTREYANVQAARLWFRERNHFVEEAVLLAQGLAPIWHRQGRFQTAWDELKGLLERAAERLPRSLKANLSGLAARFAWHLGDYGPARELLQRAAAIYRREGGGVRLAETLETLGHLHGDQVDDPGAEQCYQEALRLHIEAAPEGDGRLRCLACLGRIVNRRGDYAAARRLHREALAGWERAESAPGIALALANLGTVEYHAGDWETATQLYRHSLARWRAVGEAVGAGHCLLILGELATHAGRTEEARPLLEEGLALWKSVGHRQGVADSLQRLAMLELAEGHRAAARDHLAAGLEAVRRLDSELILRPLLTACGWREWHAGRPERAARLLYAGRARWPGTGEINPCRREAEEQLARELLQALGEEQLAAAQAATRLWSRAESIEYALECLGVE